MFIIQLFYLQIKLSLNNSSGRQICGKPMNYITYIMWSCARCANRCIWHWKWNISSSYTRCWNRLRTLGGLKMLRWCTGLSSSWSGDLTLKLVSLMNKFEFPIYLQELENSLCQNNHARYLIIISIKRKTVGIFSYRLTYMS